MSMKCRECGSAELNYEKVYNSVLSLSYDKDGNFLGRDYREADETYLLYTRYDCEDCGALYEIWEEDCRRLQ